MTISGSTPHYEVDKSTNDRSKAWATNNGKPWSKEDEAIVRDCWRRGGDACAIETSKRLGRTIESCRVKYLELLRNDGMAPERQAPTTPEGDKPYIGAFDDPEDVWWK